MTEPGPDPALLALVRLSGAVAGGADLDLDPFLRRAAESAPAKEVEEALLQSYLFLGYPTALNALRRWREVSGTDAPAELPGGWDEWADRGPGVCRRVYGSAYPDLRENIAGISPEMDRWMVVEGYGKVLGRPGLAMWRRECCIVAILAVLGTGRQLRSHLRGALRTGAPVGVVAAVVEEACALTAPARRIRAREVWRDVNTRWENR